jgi:O-antigen ligase
VESRPLNSSSPNQKPASRPQVAPVLPRWFLLSTGTIFGLIFVKQGNPVIFARMIARPTNLAELVFQFWPISWGYQMGLVLGLATVLMWLRSGVKPRLGFDAPWPLRCMALAGVWFGWQVLAATTSVQAELTSLVLAQFLGCVACLAFGLFVLRDMKPAHAAWFWLPVLLAFSYSLWAGWDQHFGGLEQIRKEVMAGRDSITNSVAGNVAFATLHKKAMSNRIYGTFVYPNTFAGGILLMLPITLAWIKTAGRPWRAPLRLGLMGLFAGVSGACLIWSGSKSAWLIAVVMGGIAIWRSPWQRKWKLGITVSLAIVGLTAFGIRYAGYFRKGASSVEARLDYWRAAVEITRTHPGLGTGPGTFQIPYQRLKDPDAEMARLAHNDFLEQASDSGIVGFILYLGLIAALAWSLYRQPAKTVLPQAALLGWTGVQLQSLSEFNLYIPGLAWTGFLLAGWLLGRNRFDTGNAGS